MDPDYTLDDSRKDMTAALDAIRGVFEEELGTRKWEKRSPELVGECTVEGTGRYRSVILGNDAPISPDR